MTRFNRIEFVQLPRRRHLTAFQSTEGLCGLEGPASEVVEGLVWIAKPGIYFDTELVCFPETQGFLIEPLRRYLPDNSPTGIQLDNGPVHHHYLWWWRPRVTALRAFVCPVLNQEAARFAGLVLLPADISRLCAFRKLLFIEGFRRREIFSFAMPMNVASMIYHHNVLLTRLVRYAKTSTNLLDVQGLAQSRPAVSCSDA